MHYYQHNIKDFNNATRHLTHVERALYREAIELYYTTEQPLPGDEKLLCRRLLAVTEEEKEAVSTILFEFFYLSGGAYHHDRCEDEIEKYRANSSAKARAGKASAEARRKKREAQKEQEVTGVEQVLESVGTEGQQNPTNQEPITNNQEPITTTQSDEPDTAEQLFQYWVMVMEKTGSTKFTSKRRKNVLARIKDNYTPEQIKTAIDNCRADPWSMGQNDRNTPFNDLELICRTGEKLESFIDKTAPAPTVQPLQVVHGGKTRDRSLQDDLSDTSWAR